MKNTILTSVCSIACVACVIAAVIFIMNDLGVKDSDSITSYVDIYPTTSVTQSANTEQLPITTTTVTTTLNKPVIITTVATTTAKPIVTTTPVTTTEPIVTTATKPATSTPKPIVNEGMGGGFYDGDPFPDAGTNSSGRPAEEILPPGITFATPPRITAQIDPSTTRGYTLEEYWNDPSIAKPQSTTATPITTTRVTTSFSICTPHMGGTVYVDPEDEWGFTAEDYLE